MWPPFLHSITAYDACTFNVVHKTTSKFSSWKMLLRWMKVLSLDYILLQEQAHLTKYRFLLHQIKAETFSSIQLFLFVQVWKEFHYKQRVKKWKERIKPKEKHRKKSPNSIFNVDSFIFLISGDGYIFRGLFTLEQKRNKQGCITIWPL